MVDATPEPNSLLPKLWKVPSDFRERLGTRVGRQRVMHQDGHLLLVLHAPPSPSESERSGRFFWRTPDGQWSSTEKGPGLESLKSHVEAFADRTNEIDEDEDRAENSDDYFRVLNQLAPVQRAARNLYDVLSDARKLCKEDRGLLNVRDAAYELVRRIDLLNSHTKASMEYEVAKRTEQQAAASHQMAIAAHQLNRLAAFFFPVLTISAILGMNVPTGLERLPWPIGILLVGGFGLLSGLLLTKYLAPPAN